MADLYLTEKCSGRQRKAMYVDCAHCGKSFLTRKDQIRKYCSVECSSLASRNRVELCCDYCGKIFERVANKLNSSKSGLHFCSRECKENAQSLSGGFKELQPEHYGTGYSVYRYFVDRAENPECCDCSEDRRYLLVTHHIDGDRTNNDKENLEIVCHNCHAKRHLRQNDLGVWVFSTSSITPREQLDKI
jgi:hypothetical protein